MKKWGEKRKRGEEQQNEASKSDVIYFFRSFISPISYFLSGNWDNIV